MPGKTPDQLAHDLRASLSSANIIGVKRLIRAGAPIDTTDFKDRTVLHFAMETQDEELFRLCLEHDADVNARDKDGVTPLLDALRNAADPWVDELLARGADATETDNEGRNPLHYAALVGTPEIIDKLVKAGADPTGIEQRGMTPMDYAREAQTTELEAALRDAVSRKHAQKVKSARQPHSPRCPGPGM